MRRGFLVGRSIPRHLWMGERRARGRHVLEIGPETTGFGSARASVGLFDHSTAP
jgi:hypothetical protein